MLVQKIPVTLMLLILCCISVQAQLYNTFLDKYSGNTYAVVRSSPEPSDTEVEKNGDDGIHWSVGLFGSLKLDQVKVGINDYIYFTNGDGVLYRNASDLTAFTWQINFYVETWDFKEYFGDDFRFNRWWLDASTNKGYTTDKRFSSVGEYQDIYEFDLNNFGNAGSIKKVYDGKAYPIGVDRKGYPNGIRAIAVFNGDLYSFSRSIVRRIKLDSKKITAISDYAVIPGDDVNSFVFDVAVKRDRREIYFAKQSGLADVSTDNGLYRFKACGESGVVEKLAVLFPDDNYPIDSELKHRLISSLAVSPTTNNVYVAVPYFPGIYGPGKSFTIIRHNLDDSTSAYYGTMGGEITSMNAAGDANVELGNAETQCPGPPCGTPGQAGSKNKHCQPGGKLASIITMGSAANISAIVIFVVASIIVASVVVTKQCQKSASRIDNVESVQLSADAPSMMSPEISNVNMDILNTFQRSSSLQAVQEVYSTDQFEP